MTADALPNEDRISPPEAGFFWKMTLVIVATVFGGLALWSLTAPIDGAVIANGEVVVETNRKAVQHLEGGVIGAVLVREGGRVAAGDLVASLDNTVQKANLAMVDSQLTELYARRARLEAERDQLDQMTEPYGAPAILATAAFQAKLSGQRRLFNARKTTSVTQVELLNERIVQQGERIRGHNAQISSLGDQNRLISDELAGVRDLHEQGFAPLTRVRELERESKRLIGERGALQASIAEAESIIAEAKLEIERLGEAAREEAIAELRETEVSISELEERRITALDAMRRTEIRAPHAGRVIGLSVHTIGGVIAPGEPLMEIVPDDDRLQVAARVAPQDVDKVQAGQKTLIRFSAFGASRAPEAFGVVQTVSADSMVDEITGAPFYLVAIEIPDATALSEVLDGQRLVPGMPVEAFIQTGASPAISYFLRPLTDAMARSMRDG